VPLTWFFPLDPKEAAPVVVIARVSVGHRLDVAHLEVASACLALFRFIGCRDGAVFLAGDVDVGRKGVAFGFGGLDLAFELIRQAPSFGLDLAHATEVHGVFV
jgi:hypothetical protein